MTNLRQHPKVRLNQPWDILARTVLNNAISGNVNVVGELVLNPGMGTTILDDPLITQASCISLMPTTANAASALPTLYFDTPEGGSVVIHHANSTQPDRRFRYVVFG